MANVSEDYCHNEEFSVLSIAIKRAIQVCCPSDLKPVLARIEASEIGYRLVKGTFWSVAGTVISRGLMFAAWGLVARMLGKTDYGELGMIQSTVGMFGVFAGFGLGLTATKHVAEYRSSDPKRAGRIIVISGLVAMVTGGLMATGLFVFASWLAEHTINAPHLAGVLRISALILFVNALNGAQTGALAGFEAFKTIAYVNLFVGIISFPILVGGAYFGGLTGAVWALAINLIVNWFLNHLALRKEAHRHKVTFSFRKCSHELAILWSFSLPMVLSSSLAGPVMWVCNSLLVNKPEGYAELGLYTAVYKFYSPAIFLTAILSNVYLPILSNSYASDSSQRFSTQAKRMLMTNGLGLLFLFSLFLGISPILLPMYGNDYDFRFLLVFLVILSATLSAFGGYLNSVLVAMNIPWYGLIGNALWAIIYVGLFLYCSRYGAIGMAFSLSVSLLCSQVFIEYHMLKRIFQQKGNPFAIVFFRIFSFFKSIYRRKNLLMSTTTAFLRNIVQLNTIYDLANSPQRIYVFACSQGCEAYSLAMIYHKKNPDSIPHIFGFDIDRECLKKAEIGIYSAKDLLYGSNRHDETTVTRFLSKYLVLQDDGNYRVVESIQSQCSFAFGSILDPQFTQTLDKADIVFCQNVLIHMTEAENKDAIELLANTVRPGGLLVIGGMRLPVRERIMKISGLVPITTNCREIHEAQKDLRNLWNRNMAMNRSYIAMPPFTQAEGWEYQFSTIFRKEGSKST